MKIALASYGSRGDVEPCVAIGRELQRRGHDVRIAAPPDLVGFVESVGLTAVPYGPDVQSILGAHREFWTYFFRNFWKVRRLIQMRREIANPVLQRWDEVVGTLASLGDWADVLVTGVNFELPAANVAERYGIPLAAVHLFPIRANSHFLSLLPASAGRSAMKVYEWLGWRAAKKLDDTQRRELGLPESTRSLPQRIGERGWLEIQAYDEACFAGLADEWADYDEQRPFVGALVIDQPTAADEQVASWISAGSPPIFFGFGSMPVKSPADTLEMISSVCAQLGERALVCAAGSDFTGVSPPGHVMVVDAMNYAAAFPACRALVHHGGTGTTATGLRAGVPTLILSTDIDQTLWGSRVKRMKVGAARRLSRTTRDSLTADLTSILAPEYSSRAREVAARMTKPAESAAAAADLVEKLACRGLR
ncbi:glycosyltransferase [Mycolicibacterium celeriflavum]|uniref:glycosyltransferase n=1 Tax=Mycolicibacterium celeriflavum TaxID=1249101 RepID=UPI003CE877A7